ncbi:MAG TPA: adenylate/guanylate cyclase domain-containing protein, partial [Geminicoccaceae bacterium]|nr:adenylate/guanylate cyclase domain-containing protein [Geminicoccaceae bacterium]
MARTYRRTFVWRFDSPPGRVWPALADTVRFNEAARLPKHEITEIPQPDGSVLYLGRMRRGPFRLAWRERPVNWVTGRWFEHRRDFTSGPLKSLCAAFELTPEGDGGSRGDYTIAAEAAGPLGHLILGTGFFRSAARTFGALAESAGRFARGERATPFDVPAPAISDAVRRRVEGLVGRVEATGHGHGLAGRLAELVLTGAETDVGRLRPLALARAWGVDPPREVVELCLEATRAGLLALRWDLLCPRCRVAKAVVGALDELPRGAHCSTCNIDYGRDFSQNVELSFQPAPAVRPLEAGEYCLFGPMSTPHVRIQLTVGPGETRTVRADLAPGAYRLRTLEPGPEAELDWDSAGGFPEMVVGGGAVAVGAPAAGPGEVRVTNRDGGRELTAIVEDRAWVRDALTADRVTTLQAFRDLFSDQVLRPGDEVAVRRVTLMFTDLRGSTALYARIGDAAAYRLVRDHFAFLAEVVRAHDGAIVKTIGDAIMGAFAEPADALRAALAVQRGVIAFNARLGGGEGIVIKLGLHEGPCIAVNLNDRLDYFGGTANMAARLQGQSRGGDVVLSEGLAADPAVAPLLAGLDVRRERAGLKGF